MYTYRKIFNVVGNSTLTNSLLVLSEIIAVTFSDE